MTILEILEAHTRSFRTGRCSCDNHGTKRTFHGHRSHVAGVLEEHMQEREAEAWDKGRRSMTMPTKSCYGPTLTGRSPVMGADEKHAATYHGGEYTPPVRDLRTSYVALRDKDTTSLEEAREEFQRGIDRIRAEAKAEALEEAAAYAVEWVGIVGDGALVDLQTESEYDDTAGWLRARANQYKENQ